MSIANPMCEIGLKPCPARHPSVATHWSRTETEVAIQKPPSTPLTLYCKAGRRLCRGIEKSHDSIYRLTMVTGHPVSKGHSTNGLRSECTYQCLRLQAHVRDPRAGADA